MAKAHAGRHGVTQLIAHASRPHVPPAEREWCDRVLTGSWTKYARNLAALEKFTGMLDSAGVRCLAMKGPLLARRHYHPPFLRKPSVDIDLAVRRCDLERARDVFAAEGYAADMTLSEALSRNHHLGMTHVGAAHEHSPRLELHFRLSHAAFGVPVDEFFDHAVPCALPNGSQAMVMCPGDEIFHLVLHRAFGRFATLFHLYEIRRLWAAASPDTRLEALRRAAEHHFTGAFAMTDVAFRVRWGEHFLADGDLPKTWLHWRIDERLYKRFEALSDPGRALPLGARVGRRWIDFQVTDRPSDARRLLAIMARVAWYQLRGEGRNPSPTIGQ